MIYLTKTIICDGCGYKIGRQIIIESVSVIDEANANNFFKLLVPVVPNEWTIQPSKKVGEPDRVYCSPNCITLKTL